MQVLSNILDVIKSAVLLRDAINSIPLIHENGDIVLIPEGHDELIEVIDMPLLVEINRQVSIPIFAALRNPSFVEIPTQQLRSRVLVNAVVEYKLVWIEVVERVNDVLHVLQVSIVIECVQLIVRPRANHARSSWVYCLHSLAAFPVNLSYLL